MNLTYPLFILLILVSVLIRTFYNQSYTYRAQFAKSILENAFHAPSTAESAKEKIQIVFGDTNFEWDGTAKSAGIAASKSLVCATHTPLSQFY